MGWRTKIWPRSPHKCFWRVSLPAFSCIIFQCEKCNDTRVVWKSDLWSS